MGKRLIVAAAFAVAVVATSQADVVLKTDFTGFTAGGTTISNLTWFSELGEGANATTNLALTGSASGFITVTPGAGGTGPAVGVSGNIETVDPWSISFTFTPSQSIDITRFDISSYSINSSGGHQGLVHTVDWELEITSAGTDFTGNATETELGGTAPQAFSIDTTGTTLSAGTTYTFNLTVSAPAGGGGNNIALDMFTLKNVATGAPNILDFSASSANVLIGEMVTLSWNVEDETSLSLNQGIGDVTGMSSTQVVVNADTSYTLTASNANGSTNESVLVTLITTVPVINSFTASKTIVSVGDTVTLAWDVVDETGLSIDQGLGDVTGLTSTQVVVNADTTYTLTASNANGSTNESVAIAIGVSSPLLAHYTFDVDGTATVGTDAVLGSAASIDALDPVIGAGALALSGTPDPETSGSDGAVSGNVFDWSADDTRTVAFWMKAVAGDKGDNNATMISLGSGSGGGNRFDIRLAGNALRLEVQAGGSTTSTNIADGTWHHVAIVVPDGASVSDVSYYIDGSYLGNFSSGTAIATGIGPLRMGDSYQDGGRDFKGSLDDVRLYETELSAEEILELATILQYPGDPVADLAISGPVSGGTGMVLSWTGESGKPYGVETNSNLIISNDWTVWITGQMGDGGTITVTNPIGLNQTFYRVISEQPE